MKHVKKWMVVPFIQENESELTKNAQLSQVIGNNNESADKKVKIYNQINNKKRKEFIKEDYQSEPVAKQIIDIDNQDILSTNTKRILTRPTNYNLGNDDLDDTFIINDNQSLLNQSLPEQSLLFDDNEFYSNKKLETKPQGTRRKSISNKKLANFQNNFILNSKQTITPKRNSFLPPDHIPTYKLIHDKKLKNTADNSVARVISPDSAKRNPSNNTRSAAAKRKTNVKQEWNTFGNRS
jgi:hypothetical protein